MDEMIGLTPEQKLAIYNEVLEQERSKKPWRTKDSNIFVIGDRKIAILKRGREQAVQIEKLNKWLSENIAPLSDSLKADVATAGWELFMSMMSKLTADAQMELASILVGNRDADGQTLPTGFLDEYYELSWVVDAVSIAGQGASIQKLMTAFFSNVG